MNACARLLVSRKAAHVVRCEILEEVAIDVLALDDKRLGSNMAEVAIKVVDVALVPDLLFRLVVGAFGDERNEAGEIVSESFEEGLAQARIIERSSPAILDGERLVQFCRVDIAPLF